MKKIIAIIGPTASGKSALALEIAKQYNGELINADSRQMYKGFNIGAAKDKGKWEKREGKTVYIVEGISEHLVDFLQPNEPFSASEFQEKAYETIEEILSRGKLPIIVGGTGYYTKAVIENLHFPEVEPNKELRRKLETKTLEELTEILRALDPRGVSQIDNKNRRKLIRAIEVSQTLKKPYSEVKTKGKQKYDALCIGIEMPKEKLNERINKRVEQMVEEGLIQEVKTLLKQGANETSSAMTAIGYREVIDHIKQNTTKEQMIEKIQTNTRRLAKKQISWFRKDKKTIWTKTKEKALNKTKSHLK